MTNRSPSSAIPSSLTSPRAAAFWCAVVLTGAATGVSAILLTRLLEITQRYFWGGSGRDILDAAQRSEPSRHLLALAAAGVITGAGQLLLGRLASGNGIDTTAAIWFFAGRVPVLRTLGSAVLSVVIVGMGASLGREGAPKQSGAVFANLFADRLRLSEEQRRLLVACGAGAGMSAAYGVPLGGSLFSLEVIRGILALRYVLPALVTSAVATGLAWMALPDNPTYQVPEYPATIAAVVFAFILGPIAGIYSAAYIRLITWAERHKPQGWWRMAAPIAGLSFLGVLSVAYPQLLGNGRDVSQLAFSSLLIPSVAISLLALKPFAIALCIGCGAPGGLFTPSLTSGAMLGATLGFVSAPIAPAFPHGIASLLGATAVLAATTQGPISAVILMMELTGHVRSLALPMIIAAALATMVSRTIDARSVYDARLSDEQIQARQRIRDSGLPLNENTVQDASRPKRPD